MKKIPKHFVFLILSILLTNTIDCYSQVIVYNMHLDSIEQLIKETPEKLILRNQKCIYPDSVVTIDDYFYLYYGSAYLEGYSPYGEGSLGSDIYELLNENKNKDVIDLCNNLILEHPGFIRPFYFLGIAYYQSGDTATSAKFFSRFYDFLNIPYFSGNGTSSDNAFVVRSVDDEYLIVSELGLEVESQALIQDNNIPFDILTVSSETDSLKQELYFNVYQPFNLGLNFSNFEKVDNKKGNKKKKKQKNSKE